MQLNDAIDQYTWIINRPNPDAEELKSLGTLIDSQSAPQEHDNDLSLLKTKFEKFLGKSGVTSSSVRIYMNLEDSGLFFYSIQLTNLKDRYSQIHNGKVFISLVSKNETRYWASSMKFVLPTELKLHTIHKYQFKPIIKDLVSKGYSINTTSDRFDLDPDIYIQRTTQLVDRKILDIKAGTSEDMVKKIQARLAKGKRSKLLEFNSKFSIVIG